MQLRIYRSGQCHSLCHPPPRTTTFSAYERSVGFASIAIVVVCGRCVLHRLGSTTYKHPCLNSGRSISGILARPLPKVSFCCLSLAQPTIEGSPPRLSPLPQTPPTPHYPSPRTTQNPNLPPAAVTTIIHHSLFIIHYSLFIIHYSLFIKQKVRAFSDNGPRYKISM